MITESQGIEVSIDNGTTWVDLTPYLLDTKWGWHKGWGNDTGRNLKGTFSGTFLGTFPKLTLTIGALTKDQYNTLAPIFDSARQKIRYYDGNANTQKIMETYNGDWEPTQQNIGQIDQSFTIAFISREARS